MKTIEIHEIACSCEWMYGINYKYGVLCKINKNTQKVDRLHSFCEIGENLQYEYATEFYRHIVVAEDVVYVMNTCTNKVLVYDDELRFRGCMEVLKKEERLSFLGMDNDVLYVYAVQSGIIIGVNIKSKEIVKYQLPECYIGKINSFGIKLINSRFWLSGYIGDVILEVDVWQEKIFEHKLESVEGDICLCSEENNILYLCTQYGIYEWNPQKNEICETVVFSDEIQLFGSEMPFYFSAVIDRCMWLFPLNENPIMKYDIRDKSVQMIPVPCDYINPIQKKTLSFLALDEENGIVIGLNKEMRTIALNVKRGTIQCLEVRIDEELLGNAKKHFAEKEIYLEEGIYNLEDLMEFSNNTQVLKSNLNNGKTIFYYLNQEN